MLPPPTSEVEVKDEPVQSGGGHEVPPMPPGAFVKKEEEGVVPPMPPGARWGVEVDDLMPMPSDEEAAEEETAEEEVEEAEVEAVEEEEEVVEEEDRYATQWSPAP